MSPVMRWAAFYVEHVADAVIEHRELQDADRVIEQKTGKSVDERLDEYFERLRMAGRKLPGKAGGTPNYKFILKSVGSGPSQSETHERSIRMIDRAWTELGVDLFTGPALPETSQPVIVDAGRGLTWLELGYALTACYLIAATYSGARDSEVTDWRYGCLEIIRNSDGSIKRYKVNGRILKGERSFGSPHKWVVIEPVARAIQVAEKIQKYVDANPQIRRTARSSSVSADYLFASPILQGESRSGIEGEGVAHNYSAKIRYFCTHCGALTSTAVTHASDEEQGRILELYAIRDTNGDLGGEPWQWATMQLRRTFAWYIANQPFGVVAGKIQYRHAALLMFEGYAGNSQSGFRAEIEQEQMVCRMVNIVADYEAWKRGHEMAGPMGSSLRDSFEAVYQRMGDLPGTIADEGRLKRMLKSLVANIHPGYLNDCHFYPEHALCLQHKPNLETGPEIDGPFWAGCDPERCPNSMVTHRHVPALKECKADNEAMLKFPGLSPLQRLAIQNGITQVNSLLRKVTG